MNYDKAAPGFRSGCPVATTLDLVGDRWTLVILRDLLNGKSRWSELVASPERIPTNILADRLKRMVEDGLVTRQAYREAPVRHAYGLTEKGAALRPVLQAMCRWANRYYPETWTPPESFMAPSGPS